MYEFIMILNFLYPYWVCISRCTSVDETCEVTGFVKLVTYICYPKLCSSPDLNEGRHTTDNIISFYR